MSPSVRIAVAMAVLTVGCGPTKASGVPARLVVSGAVQLIGVGATTQWTVRERQTDYTETDVPGAVTWSSSDPKVASVSSNGLVTAVGVGATTITASYQSLASYQTLHVMELAPLALVVTTDLELTDIGQTTQLSAAVKYNNNTTVDVSGDTQWTSSDPSVLAVTPSGAVTVISIGSATITGRYGTMSLTTVVNIAPPGTFTVSGRVRLPGAGEQSGLGVPGFTVTNLDHGNTTVSDARGQYAIPAASIGTHLTFEKDGFETADLVVTGPSGSPTVQKLIRIMAGDTASTLVLPNDISYDPSPSFHCPNCRLIRVVSPAPGGIHVQIDWSGPVDGALWVDGGTYGPTGPRQLVTNIPAFAGELLLYVRSGGSDYVTMTLRTSFTPRLGPSHWE